jgi:hypothetical protein
VPVALNLYKVRQDRGEAGDFFRSVQRQKPNYQGLWLVSPEGGTASLAYEGEIAATHRGTKDEGKEGKHCSSAAKLLGGVGVYDVKSGRLLSLPLVFDGHFRNDAPYEASARFGAVVEWSQGPAKR